MKAQIYQIWPISLLPSISKIFEKVILEQLSTYLDNNNLIHKHQYGFRKHHSTEYATLHILDYLNCEMDLKGKPINLYLDLSKAFDSLFHKILLSKLTLSDPGYFRQLTIRGWGDLKSLPLRSRKLLCQCSLIIHVHFTRCFKHVPIGI